MAKPLICKFKAKTAHSPDGADSASAAEEGQHEEQAPPPPAAAEAAAAACESPAPPTPPQSIRGQRTEEQKDLQVPVFIKTCLCLH